MKYRIKVVCDSPHGARTHYRDIDADTPQEAVRFALRNGNALSARSIGPTKDWTKERMEHAPKGSV